MSYGALYGVGVGPGAPDLITLRALATLKKAQVVVLPRSSDHRSSLAWRIIEPTLGKIAGQERLFLTFPMTKRPEQLNAAWERALAEIGERLERGLAVAFATEGDPSLYSTFGYLQREAPRRWPGVRVEVIPGVSSVVAAPAATGISLADGTERIAILPVVHGVDDLAEVLDAFDTTVLMKIGPDLPAVLAVLERLGLTQRAVYVSRATMPEQTIVEDVRNLAGASPDYFSMIIVARKERSGVLLGAASPRRRARRAGR